ncbi:SRPBCC domain-containing protein [Paenibacillus glycanilyticus]|uniref:SRPBCC family protein n=1 Tax=Paenibacillus glycanilyticus TaxID=126569 RepID=UPI00203EFA63|nr:SRPBCC domain-containing protein [Paenibacillus glycanilyticus]MCM3629680.1 SRPBCC domain-containing protein [Paenibacillus glycanilyticus]
MEKKTVGLTQDAGYQIGVRKTLAAGQEQLWSYLTSPAGLGIWLGKVKEWELAPKKAYRTEEGIAGELRVVKPNEQIRLTWQPEGWDKPSTIQIRLIAAAEGRTTVSFHQEHLSSQQTRAQMKLRFEEALSQLAEFVED